MMLMPTTSTSRATVRPLTGPDDLRQLEAAAAADEHVVVWPTLAIEKNGALVGYLSVGEVALVNMWAHTKRVTARDTFTHLRVIEAKLANAGFPAVCFPVAPNSPFKPLMPHLGYQHFGEYGFWMKTLTRPMTTPEATHG